MPELLVPPKEAIRLMTERINAIPALQADPASCGYYDAVGWCTKTYAVIDRVYGPADIRAEEIRMMGLPGCSCSKDGQSFQVLDHYRDKILTWIDEIAAGITSD